MKRNTTVLLQATSLDEKWKIPVHVHRPAMHHPQTEATTLAVVGVPRSPPILLIAGWAGVSTDWGSFPKMLAARTKRDVITYDARGLGNSKCISSIGVPRSSPDGLEGEFDEDALLLSLDSMALDAVAVVNSYYEYQCEILSASNFEAGNNHNNKLKAFCVGGVSMGGMVAQALTQLIHGGKESIDATITNQISRYLSSYGEEYQITSIGLISSSPIRQKRASRAVFLRDQEYCKNIPSDHFLASFDDFDNMQLRIDSAKRFFQALGHDFLAQPGRKALQEKLISAFISSREGFRNGIGMKSILAQRRVILNEVHGFWWEGDQHHGRQFLSHCDMVEMENNHPLYLSNFEMPKIIVHGTKDEIVPYYYAEVLHALATTADTNRQYNKEQSTNNIVLENCLSPIHNCGHFPWITNAHELLNILGHFWSNQHTHP